MSINYDILDTFSISLQNSIEYIYATDGRRLRTKHYRLLPNSSYSSLLQRGNLYRQIGDSTDYVGNLILKNGKPQMYIFSGGYYSFNGDNKPECHYDVQDYQGNNRMVVNAHTNEVEQTTHYYPYGGIIGNLSSNQEAQKYKYSGKALAAIEKIDNLRREREALAEGQDRTYGLDLYDFQARLFNPALPVFDRPDPLAEDFTWLTPYNYCAGDPVNCVDKDGKMPLLVTGAIGAVIGAGIGAATAYFSGGTSEEIKNAAIAGAAGGFLAGSGAGLIAAAGLTGGSATAAGALVSGISSGVEQGLNDYQNKGEVDWGKTASSAITGAGMNVLGGALSTKVKNIVAQKVESSAAKTFQSEVSKEVSKLESIQNKGGNIGGSKTGGRGTQRTNNEIVGKAEAKVRNYNEQNQQWVLNQAAQATKVANNAATSILIVGENAVWDYYRNKNDEK